MKTVTRRVASWLALALAVGAGCQSARAGEADEIALAERIAALSERFGNGTAAAPYRASMLDGAGRLAEKEVRFRRARLRAAELAGDSDQMLAAVKEWRALEPANLVVQKRQIDLYVDRLQTLDDRLEYLKKVIGAEKVDADVRSHAAMHASRLFMEQSRTQQALEMLRKSLQLNAMNVEAMRLHWQIAMDRATPAQRLELLLSMLKANPASTEVVLLVAGELADANLVQNSLQWYGHAAGISRSLGGLVGSSAKDYAAELLIAGQDRAAAEVTSRLLARDATDPGAWFLTLLAEKGMKDRIEEVRKNALIGLLNQVAAVRSKIGVQGATSRPLGSPDASLPDLSADVALLEKVPEALPDYVAAVSDVAWFLLFFADRPADAEPMLKVLAATGKVNPELMARLEGWHLLKSGKVDEARVKLSPLADRDPLAGVGMVKVYQQDPGSTAAAVELARKLVLRYPSRLAGAMVRSELAAVAGDVAPEPYTEAMRDAVDRFPREVFRIAQQPQEFLAMRVSPMQVAHDFAEPILIEMELRNTQNLPIVLGPTGMARDYWVDVQCRGVLTQWVSGAVYDKIDGPTVIGPGQSVKWVTRLDRGPLAKLLESGVQQPMQMGVFALTNAVPADGVIGPGPCGIRGRMAQMVERRAANLGSEAAMRRANEIISANDPVLKLRLIDQVTAHLALAANPEGPQAVKSLEAELRDMLIRMGQDAAPTVRAWAKYRSGETATEPAQKVAGDLAKEQVWFVRLLGTALTAEMPDGARNSVLQAAVEDQDATVRRAALAMPAALAAQSASQKQ